VRSGVTGDGGAMVMSEALRWCSPGVSLCTFSCIGVSSSSLTAVSVAVGGFASISVDEPPAGEDVGAFGKFGNVGDSL